MLLKTKKSKKAVSVVVGYVLLVVFAIVIGGLTYTWIKTYVPTESLECQEGVSVFIKKSVFNDSTSELKITVKNTGRFNIAGYFIHATNQSDQKLATIDLSGYLNESLGGEILGNSVLFFSGVDNYLKSGEEVNHVFNISNSGLGTLYKVKVTPVRFEEIENRNRFVSCENSKTEQVIGEDIEIVECIPDCSGRICGPDPVCGESCGTCTGTDSCDTLGQCISESCTPAADPTLSGVCGADICGTGVNGTCGSVSCGICNTGIGEICSSGSCTLIGNGNCDSGETCAEEPTACEGQQAQCSTGQICESGNCVSDATYGIDDYCRDLNIGYTGGVCVANNGGCINQGGELVVGGDSYCTPSLGCCTPTL